MPVRKASSASRPKFPKFAPLTLDSNCLNPDSLDSGINRIMQHETLTHKIIGCAMNVHKALGNGFQEVIYQRTLEIEMQRAGLNFAREMEMPIFYRDIQIGTRRVDFFVENLIMVELKSLTSLENIHLAQAKNYLEAYKMQIGLLINFGANKLEFKRVYIDKPISKNRVNP
ncbi:MAG: GxxExxY protein [Fibromonadaceae bacterium]|nr:GxxExxY protein [Fibromonadaceae bacterium]